MTPSIRSAARRTAAAIGLLLLLMLLAWWAVPYLVASQLQSRGSQALGRPVAVQRVEFEPWRLALTLHGLTIGAAPAAGAGAPPQLEIKRLFVDEVVVLP